MKFALLLAIVSIVIVYVSGDCYMQNPRGSNDRLAERNNNRNNDERLFDSQNNGAGGYCWGPPLYFYVGSMLSIEWTAQHSCGSDRTDCEIVLQYMCGTKETVRDGYGFISAQSTTNTPPDTQGSTEYQRKTGAGTSHPGEYVYGLHEPFEYYQNCRTRFRNKGLYTANEGVSNTMDSANNNNGRGATATRQNPGGNGRRLAASRNGGRNHGFECPEERDYYPYWHSSPWKDIAVLTTNMGRCAYYARESQNVKSRWRCTDNIQNNEQKCNAIGGQQWVEDPAHGIAAPDCKPAPWNRDNHLGNGLDGHASRYNWTIPDDPNPACVLRIRYNITTKDGSKNYWDLTAKDNGINAPVSDDPRPFISGNRDTSVDEVSGLTQPATASNIWHLEMAINTNQFGRTFQDRSHTFEIRARTGAPATARIFNLNVRGKRGNIVETYPGTEYDFVPQDLFVKQNDYVHIQWTGCDNNPDRQNNGNGERATDRSNILGIKGNKIGANLPFALNDTAQYSLFDFDTLQNLAWIGQTDCETYEQIKTRVGNNANNRDNDRKNCGVLNGVLDANGLRTPYFDGGLIKISGTGYMHYMSSRNNDFSNRSHKAVIVSESLVAPWGIAIMVIGGVAFGAAIVVALMVKFAPGSALALAANTAA